MLISRHHVVALTPGRSKALALRTPAGWLLPSLEKSPELPLPKQIYRLLGRLVPTAAIVHEAPLQPDPGIAIDEFYLLASFDGDTLTSEIAAVPVTELLATDAMFSVQRDALQSALSREHHPTALFDSAQQVTSALAWATTYASACLGSRVVAVEPHRCARHEHVAKVQTETGAAYFKGGRERVLDEAKLTQLLWTVRPDQFPRTLAVDLHARRWLYHELEGDLLVGPRLTPQNAVAAVRALAFLQKQLVAHPAVECHLFRRRMDAREIWTQANLLVERIWTSDTDIPPSDGTQSNSKGLLRAWWHCQHDIGSVCAEIDALDIPLSLVPDFWGRNILLTTGGIGFIDVEHSHWTCPWLPLLRFINEVELSLDQPGVARELLQEAYVSAWANVVPPRTMIRALAHLRLMGRLFNLLLTEHELALREHELGDGVTLPSWYRAHRLEPHVRRVLYTLSSEGPPHASRPTALPVQ